MATNSGLYVTNWLNVLNATQLAVDFTLANSINVALYNTAGFATANFSTEQYYSTTNEITTGGGYTQGGVVLGSPTIVESPTGTIKFNGSSVTWAASTITGVACARLFFVNNASGSAFASNQKPLIGMIYFGSGGPYSTVSGNFTIDWASTGIFSLDITP